MISLIFPKDYPGVGVGIILAQTFSLPLVVACAEVTPAVLVVGIGPSDCMPMHYRSHHNPIPLIPVSFESKPTLTTAPAQLSDIIEKIHDFFEPLPILLLDHRSFVIKETDPIQVYLLQKKVPEKYPVFYLEIPFLFISKNRPSVCYNFFHSKRSTLNKTAPYLLQDKNFCIAIALEARGPPSKSFSTRERFFYYNDLVSLLYNFCYTGIHDYHIFRKTIFQDCPRGFDYRDQSSQ